MKVGILETENFSPEVIKSLNEISELKIYQGESLEEFLSDLEVIFIRLSFTFNSDLLSKAKSLKIICSPTTGLNHIDLEECKKLNIDVLSLRGEVDFLQDIRATPEHTLGLTISLLRNYKAAFTSSNEEFNRDLYIGEELFNSRVGIIGLGRVGLLLSRYLNAMGSNVSFYDVDDKDGGDIRKMNDIADLINNNTIIVLTASYTDNYREFINKKFIDMMENKYFINTSRGELVDENYLFEKIEKNFFKGVALDVLSRDFNTEKALSLKNRKDINAIITPHIGGATYTSFYKTEKFIFEKLKRKLRKYGNL